MDSKGRVPANMIADRLRRSVKYEEVCVKDYKSFAELVTALRTYFDFYNHERPPPRRSRETTLCGRDEGSHSFGCQ